MLSTALAHWQSHQETGEAYAAVAWHSDLVRFGATQLNDRYASRFPGHRMDGAAWGAWMSVKVAWEAAVRFPTSDLPDALRNGRLRFDGHKGRGLSFRAWDHQLRQPVYIVRAHAAGNNGTEIVGQVPELGGATPADVALDELAGPPRATACSTAETE